MKAKFAPRNLKRSLIKKRSPSAPQHAYLKREAKKPDAPKKRSATPNPASSRVFDKPKSNLPQLINDMVAAIKKNKLILQKDVYDIETKGQEMIQVANRCLRIGAFKNQEKSEYPIKFWQAWVNITTRISTIQQELQNNTRLKLCLKFQACKSAVDEAQNETDDPIQRLANLFENFGQVEQALDPFLFDQDENGEGAEQKPRLKETLQKCVTSIHEVSSNAAQFTEMKNCVTVLMELEMALTDFVNLLITISRYETAKEKAETEANERIYKPEGAEQLQPQIPPSPASLKTSVKSPKKKVQNKPKVPSLYDRQVQNQREREEKRKAELPTEPRRIIPISREDIKAIQELTRANEERKKAIRIAKENRRNLQKELDDITAKNEKDSQSHESTLRAMKKARTKADRAKSELESIKKEVDGLRKQRDDLKEMISSLMSEERDLQKQGDLDAFGDVNELAAENARLVQSLSEARQSKSKLEEEWIALRAQNRLLSKQLPRDQSKAYLENAALREDYVRLSREHLSLVEASLRQQFANERARCLGEMEPDGDGRRPQTAYRDALAANQEVAKELEGLRQQRDQLEEELERALDEKYTLELELSRRGTGMQSEKGLLEELQRTKSEYDAKKKRYLEQTQRKQETTIRNWVVRGNNAVAELRNAAFDEIVELRRTVKELTADYDALRAAIQAAEDRGTPDRVVFGDRRLTGAAAVALVNEMVGEYRALTARIQDRATAEAREELRLVESESEEFERRAKKMSDWTAEVYTTLLQTQARVQTLSVQVRVLTKKAKDHGVDGDAEFARELKEAQMQQRQTAKMLANVEGALRACVAQLGGRKGLDIDQMLEEIEVRAKGKK